MQLSHFKKAEDATDFSALRKGSVSSCFDNSKQWNEVVPTAFLSYILELTVVFSGVRIALWTSAVCSSRYAALPIFCLGERQRVAVCLRDQKPTRRIARRSQLTDAARSHAWFGCWPICIYTLPTAGKTTERTVLFTSATSSHLLSGMCNVNISRVIYSGY